MISSQHVALRFFKTGARPLLFSLLKLVVINRWRNDKLINNCQQIVIPTKCFHGAILFLFVGEYAKKLLRAFYLCPVFWFPIKYGGILLRKILLRNISSAVSIYKATFVIFVFIGESNEECLVICFCYKFYKYFCNLNYMLIFVFNFIKYYTLY